jgi:hypothetical protein
VPIGRDGEGERIGFSDFSMRATKRQSSILTCPPRSHPTEESAMIDPPTKSPEDPERKPELDQTVDFAIQLLVEEAHIIGWQRAKFLTAIMDCANARLSVLEDERQLDGNMAEEPANDWPGASEK